MEFKKIRNCCNGDKKNIANVWLIYICINSREEHNSENENFLNIVTTTGILIFENDDIYLKQ